MNRGRRSALVLCLVAALGRAAFAADGPSNVPPKLDFKAYYLVDFATDTVLASNDCGRAAPAREPDEADDAPTSCSAHSRAVASRSTIRRP